MTTMAVVGVGLNGPLLGLGLKNFIPNLLDLGPIVHSWDAMQSSLSSMRSHDGN